MKYEASQREGYELLHNGIVALSEIESNGIRIDTTRLEKTKKSLNGRIRELRVDLEKSNLWAQWRKRFGQRANLMSRPQLSKVLRKMGHEITGKTETGRDLMNEESLQTIDDPDLAKLIRMLKYEKALGTYIKGIEKEIVGDRIHPVYNLHIARSYRSSSDSPNFQNFPIRDKEIGEIIRTLFTASPGCVLVENDFKGIEVSVSACYHLDRNFISYITTPGKDMHRDMAAQIFKLDPSDVSKDARQGAKNRFVFPQFYGDFYVPCARYLWDWIKKNQLKGPDGRSLFKHLKRHGIRELGDCDPEQSPRAGTFEKHIQEVENDFWNNRFMAYGQWRKDFWNSYLKNGYFDMLTGFRVHGSFTRNAVVNYPVQGSAFHCLLWSLIRVNKLMKKHRMKSRIIGQIHDSLIGDIRVEELRDYLEIVERATTMEIRQRYPWIVVPLAVEYEIAPLNGNWFQKREFHFSRGKFYHPEKPKKFTRDSGRFLEIISK